MTENRQLRPLGWVAGLTLYCLATSCAGADEDATADGSGGSSPATGGMMASGGSDDVDGVDDECTVSCPGCCDGSVCVETSTNAQCGAFGAACMVCEPWEWCNALGACGPDADSTWDVVVNSVSAYGVDLYGEDWDLLDAPDLYVCLSVNGRVNGCTTSCTDSLTCPLNQSVGTVNWGEVESGVVELWVWDEDSLDADDSGGGVLVKTSDLEAGGFVYTEDSGLGFESLIVTIEQL